MKHEYDFFTLSIWMLASAYVAYIAYAQLVSGDVPPAINEMFTSGLSQVLLIVLIVLSIIRGDWLAAVVLALSLLCLCSTCRLTLQRTQEGFCGSTVGRRPGKENYIGGIYDFTGHLKYYQLPVVPP